MSVPSSKVRCVNDDRVEKAVLMYRTGVRLEVEAGQWDNEGAGWEQ